MTWLTFLTDPAVHVLPSNNGMDVLEGHVPSAWCECKPVISDETSPHGVVWIHKHDS
jgi:hypothetical protein